jgi:8-oxo-dGTP pyrophosphatase MutT (NUDIX family)
VTDKAPATGQAPATGDVPATPRPAATLILVRARGHLPEILLLKRSATARFMPNAYVFAGGAVDAGDAADDVYGLCAPWGDEQAGTRLELPAHGLKFFIAAIREAFEEGGLLLAYDAAGHIVDLAGWDGARLHQLRTQMCAGQLSLAALCKLHGWRPAVDGLAYFAHWITPMHLKQRFDTRFFIARAPAGQRASLASEEMSDLVWRTPAEALAEHSGGALLLMHATRSILGEIARFEHIDALFAFAHTSRKILAIMPGSPAAAAPAAG